jgi:hypothetical protein
LNHDAIDFVVKTPRREDATLGLILAGLGTDFKRITEAQVTLSEKLAGRVPKEVTGLLDEAERIFVTAYEAFKKSDRLLADQAVAIHKSFATHAKSLRKGALEPIVIEAEKIANNGFYMARLVPKPLPA